LEQLISCKHYGEWEITVCSARLSPARLSYARSFAIARQEITGFSFTHILSELAQCVMDRQSFATLRLIKPNVAKALWLCRSAPVPFDIRDIIMGEVARNLLSLP